ncbi:hypothetical protein EDD22DRAFT_995834 [Suillus occidentalis]|nr:hypothetical protein EDD22DRAFT_995834 [Suillus occidentalis]
MGSAWPPPETIVNGSVNASVEDALTTLLSLTSPAPRAQSNGDSPRSAHPSAHPSRAYWDSKPPGGPPHPRSPAPPGPPEGGGHWRYDPAREQDRDAREYERERQLHEQRRQSMGFAASPEGIPHALPHHMGGNSRPSESPRPTPVPDARDRKRKLVKDSKDSDTQSIVGAGVIVEAPKKDKKRRQRRTKDCSARFQWRSFNMPATFKISSFSAKRDLRRLLREAGHCSLRLQKPFLTSRNTDQRCNLRPPTVASVSSSRSRPSPPEGPAPSKRPLSPVPDEMDTKRSRVEVASAARRLFLGSRHTPHTIVATIALPFLTQPSHSPSHATPNPTTKPCPPQLAVVLPPHPRPIGPGHAPTVPSPSDDRMILDSHRSSTPPSRGKLSEVMNPAAGSPPMKPTTSPARSQERTAPTPP